MSDILPGFICTMTHGPCPPVRCGKCPKRICPEKGEPCTNEPHRWCNSCANYRTFIIRPDGDDVEVVGGAKYVHIESMDTGHVWIGIDLPDGSQCHVHLTSRGRIRIQAEKC